MTMSSDRLRLLHGTDALLPDMRRLRAGPVEMLLDGVDLRYLRIGDLELLRRVYCAVRDGAWGTIGGRISDLVVEEGSGEFRVEWDSRHTGHEIDFEWHGTISGSSDGRIEYVFDGQPMSRCTYARIGICLHHPWVECRGASFRAVTPDGPLEGVLPDLIGRQEKRDGSYHPLFPPFDLLELELPDSGSLRFEFEGDLWEIEDHRNWTDANFKTYSTPLSLGPPVPLEVGQRLFQRVVVTPVDLPPRASKPGPVRLSIGDSVGQFPRVGIGLDCEQRMLDEREAVLLADLAPRHLRAELRLDRDDWLTSLGVAQETAGRVGTSLEVALMLRPEHVALLDTVAAILSEGPQVDRVLVTVAGGRTGTPDEVTPAGLVSDVRAALAGRLPGTRFYGGTEIYFTDLNRSRPNHTTWDGLCYSLTPQIHAFTDLDVIENLDAQAETVRAARAIADGKPVAISPITLAPRVNFYAADPWARADTPAGELPPSVDPRQSSLYGAAWTAASLAYLARSGVDSVTYYESTGWRGVLERAGGSPLPERFRSVAQWVFPLYHPLADACEWAGAPVVDVNSTSPLRAVAVAVRTPTGLCVLVANLTPQELPVSIARVFGTFARRRLDLETAGIAQSDPGRYRQTKQRITATGEIALDLGAYAVIRLDEVSD